MRLTDLQRAIIRETVAETFGAGANVWLFGSRVDDSQRGGDIDLLIATDQVDAEAITRAEIAFLAKTQMKIEEQKIDVLLDYPSRKTPRQFMRKHAELKIHLRKIKPLYHINFAVVVGKIIESCV